MLAFPDKCHDAPEPVRIMLAFKPAVGWPLTPRTFETTLQETEMGSDMLQSGIPAAVELELRERTLAAKRGAQKNKRPTKAIRIEDKDFSMIAVIANKSESSRCCIRTEARGSSIECGFLAIELRSDY